MNNFYTAVEDKTFLAQPVFKFTGERLAIIDRSECDFDGCEFIVMKDPDKIYSWVVIHPDSLPMMRDRLDDHLWSWLIDAPADSPVPTVGVTFYCGELEYALDTDADSDDLKLAWPFRDDL